MIASRFTAPLVCLCIAGCGGGCGGPGEPDPQIEAASGGETAGDPERRSEVIVDPGPPPVLRVVGEPDAHSRRVAIRIENRGREATQLAGSIELQRLAGDTWSDMARVHLDLRYSCDDEAAECVTLAPGATYLPPEWLGTIGDSQCACERCAPAEAGTYRFVVRSCDGAHTVAGQSFEAH